jgi:hypothetical protein
MNRAELLCGFEARREVDPFERKTNNPFYDAFVNHSSFF